MSEVLKVVDLTKEYATFRGLGRTAPLRAVDNISFVVNSGEVVGFLGPNGAGKSTTIKMIAGLAAPTSGEIRIDGHDVVKDHLAAMKCVSGVIESPDMYPDRSALWNLKYYASLQFAGDKTKDKKYIAERIDGVLSLVGLKGRENDKVKTYSMGMKQRLGIAQALIEIPKLLVLDEPANGLDPDGIKEIRDLLRTLAGEYGVGVLVSSHQLAEMQLMCDRCLIINRGKIIEDRKIAELNVDAKGNVCIIVKTDRPAEAAAFVREKFAAEAEAGEGEVRVHSALKASDLTRELVLAGFNVYGVSEEEVRLEDLFMHAVHGGSEEE